MQLVSCACAAFLLLFFVVAKVVGAGSKSSQYPAAPVCINCHRTETLRYLSTAMGKSFVRPQQYPNAVVKHTASGSVISVTTQNGTMFHRLKENGFIVDYPIRYQVGGGMQGSTFLVQVKDYLFESPLSWYNGFGWDVSPGYEAKSVLDFDRGVVKACLYCHATGARFDDPDGRHLISKSIQPITCERCHGASEEHVGHPTRSNIVNPAKLTGPARDSVCEQCHLEGTIRVLNPGKDWTDYHAGEIAENFFSTYVLVGNSKPEVPLASEVEQLAQSHCAQATQGKLWCGTCHNPHSAPQPRAQEIKAICTSCHQQLSPSAHATGLQECTSCHMPTTTKVTISHASHTDHRILRYPAEGIEPPQKQRLLVWREPPEQFRQRNFGLAELSLSAVDNHDLWQNGVDLLLALKPEELNKDSQAMSELEDYSFRIGDVTNALQFGRRSVELNPKSAAAALTFARVLETSGASSQAEEQFLRAISLDPSLKEAYGRLAIHYMDQQRTQDARNVLNRYLQWNSNELLVHQMKRDVLAQQSAPPQK